MKKSQLATPVGLDQDFNYLQQVERSMDDADREARERGIVVGTTSNKSASRNWQGHSGLNNYLAEHSITIQRAPVGMSRQKNNTTRSTKNGGIFWTVEWATIEKAIGIQQDCAEASSLSALYASFQAKLRRNESSDGLNPHDVMHGRKRKRPVADGKSVVTSHPTQTEHKTETAHGSGLASTRVDGKTSSTLSNHREPASNPHTSGDACGGAAGSGSPAVISEAVGPSRPDKIRSSATGPSVADVAVQNSSDTPSHQYFLSKPATKSSSRVLIPLRADGTLTESLRGQTLQEYPTIYVLSLNHENLPEGFMLEKDYKDLTAKEKREVGRTANLGADVVDNTDARQTQTAGELDAQSILKMLKRDVRR